MITELIKTSAKPKKFCEKTELIYTGGGIWIAMSPLGENKEYMVATDNGEWYAIYPNTEENAFHDILAEYQVVPNGEVLMISELDGYDGLNVSAACVMETLTDTYRCFEESERY